ncbi:hypothetical protein A3C91_02855 [Candidatus Azambacteria bacterium RIFCSPHIGHO2_02_FULL_52_12]|uniref:Uncharacterized protein n=1 Tax=Candidatus Azambacteria bacterium RIFCSPLOWO2_01_FULL_46_25 TaxID=1797298 RepID=A0A1F5BTE1_9BACT|nr:MAG: hypothetical protein A3C91_02855 [Candidatus Azambacteria bacterium RIFCSPHIGHO2_02_FULL_52_12]OGD33887.1 MAG: hypothetical protein A2988_00110 [Candidatus Azambacteria bacterium RIFCSPLOWO2_01_FULL_46_25]OGD36786.1 MAG: hypothetical protein A2850_02310 [Candidatus Azambacteria bacterium RIFCSPHIGHO2_01_FULL_51_74]
MAKKATKTIFLGLCPICRKKLHEKNLAIIDKSNVTTLCCVKCLSCESSVLFTVASQEHNMVTTVGILTDVQAQDIAMLKNGAKVDYDDVLAMHVFLEKHGTS